MIKVAHFQLNLQKKLRVTATNCGNLQKLRQFAGHGQNCELVAKRENR